MIAITAIRDSGENVAKEDTLDRRIQEEIEARIVSGEWPPGFRIPFEVELAARYGCSRMTVNKVLTRLATAGLLERRKRSGTVVARPQAQAAILEIHDIASEVQSLNQPYRYALVSRAKRRFRASDSTRLALAASASILELRCVHFAGRKPFCHEDRIINLEAVPDAETINFAVEAPGPWLMKQVPWTTAEHVIKAVPVSGEQAEALDLPDGTACLVVERRTWSEKGLVTHVRLTYPGDRHSLVAQFSPQGPRM